MFNFNFKKIDFSHKLGTSSFIDDDYEEHIHYFYEIVYFLSGDVTYTVQTETKKLSAGDMILIHPGKVHFGIVENQESYDRYVLKFPESLLPYFLREKLRNTNSFFKRKKYSFIFEKMDEYFLRYDQEELYTLFLCELIRLCIFLSNEETPENKNEHEFMSEVLEYIDEHITENINIQQISEKFYYSASYLSKEFKNVMRMSITKYIRNKKIFYAHQLMSNGIKACEASEKVGFSDYSTFYRSYLKVMGFPPSKHNENRTF